MGIYAVSFGFLKNFLLLIVFTLVFAQYDWQDNGVSVRQGIHIEWQRTGDNGNDGEMIFAWSDTRYGGRDIYAQKVDMNGNSMWGSEGSAVRTVTRTESVTRCGLNSKNLEKFIPCWLGQDGGNAFGNH